MRKVESFPIWRTTPNVRPQREVAEHPDTGDWWVRQQGEERAILIRGRRMLIANWGPWTKVKAGVVDPWRGMRIARRRHHQTGELKYRKALLPTDATPPPKRPIGRPRKDRHDDTQRHP